MLVFKFIQVFVLLSILFVMIGLFYRFIKENRNHRQRMRKLDQWSQFHGQLMDWSKEIVDDNVRVDFINHCVHKLINTSNDKLSNSDLDDWSVEEEKQKVCKEWGQHIPSLLQEMRDKKLNQIL
jgi:hypothetical protein